MTPAGVSCHTQRVALKHRFMSAKSVNVMLVAYNDLERYLDESDLGYPCWILAKKLYKGKCEDFEKVMSIATKGLRIMLRNNNSYESMPIAGTLQIFSLACFKLNRLEESLKYLNWGIRKLEELENDPSQCTNLILRNLHQANIQLLSLKHSMGTNEGCISCMVKNLRIAEKLWGKHSKELANAYREVSDLYFFEEKFQEAQPFCLKALEIYLTCRGNNSEKIAECSKQLGAIHNLLGESERAREHNRLSRKISNELGGTSFSLLAEIEAANLLIQMGKFEEALQALRDIIPRSKKGSHRISALIHMAEASFRLGKIADAKEFSEIVCTILSKKQDSDLSAANGFVGIASVYKNLNEFETALSLLWKGLAIIQGVKGGPSAILNKLLESSSEELVSLLLLTGRAEEAIPYLEVEVETAKKRFGSKHLEVGRAYGSLGTAYRGANKLHLSVQAFAYAKDIHDQSLGPYHDDSIMICKSLYSTYTDMGSYSLANTFMEVIRRMEVIGQSADGVIYMAQLQEMSSGDDTTQDCQHNNILKAINIAINNWNRKQAVGGLEGQSEVLVRKMSKEKNSWRFPNNK